MVINKKFFTLGLSAVLIIGGLFAINMMSEPGDDSTADLSADERGRSQVSEARRLETSSEEQRETVKLERPKKIEKSETPIDPKVSRIELEKALKELSEILPTWMDQKGMSFEDSREIFGQTVLRSRARHQWEGGKQMEIEISDMGEGADESVVKALGFDLKMDDLDDDSGFKEAVDQDDGEILMNYEYDYADQAGSLQVLYGDRYIIEIQIQGLPEETFQEILDKDLNFDDLDKNSPLDK